MLLGPSLLYICRLKCFCRSFVTLCTLHRFDRFLVCLMMMMIDEDDWLVMKHLVDDDVCFLLHSNACFTFEFILITSSFNSYESFSTTQILLLHFYFFVQTYSHSMAHIHAINRGAQNLKIIECGSGWRVERNNTNLVSLNACNDRAM